ncbi:Putative NADP-dependent oxidoreductase YfmJ [BD1-7 clade bacterium]|uniref:NADP-dependent oxidoreductase YfmJ n=1 Tax=BD1-7 clade bacterium TaxID=2029982 RepID=A0A5S9PWG8_9GAMM|nr:Putative NADP-dependent oxidoreductase YfmJ [BD1-7 clade bacterium]CAA0113393.1 Putative NADP-dependent oxidoreductase YfmJ [BD1-7 clade bacterium]
MFIEKSREIHLKRRPEGVPTESDFSLESVSVPELNAGEILVQNRWMSVDPYMRGRMTDRKSYIEPFKVGAVLEGGAVGVVVESNNPEFPVGSFVSSMLGWREYFVSNTSDVQKLPDTDIPDQAFLGILGMPGMTAYTGLNTIAQLQPGDRVFVSAASGAVGAIACQIAKLKGCYVAGSVGSSDKEKYLLDELGVDAVVNYKTCGNLESAISEACPEGIDVYFENVGGAHLEAVLNLMNDHGRIAVCGMIDQYNATEAAPGPVNLGQLIVKKLTMRGFIVFDHWQGYPAFVETMSQWIKNGDISWKETVLDGIEQAPAAFIGLFSGKNMGKMLVKLSD